MNVYRFAIPDRRPRAMQERYREDKPQGLFVVGETLADAIELFTRKGGDMATVQGISHQLSNVITGESIGMPRTPAANPAQMQEPWTQAEAENYTAAPYAGGVFTNAAYGDAQTEPANDF